MNVTCLEKRKKEEKALLSIDGFHYRKIVICLVCKKHGRDTHGKINMVASSTENKLCHATCFLGKLDKIK
jgi:hypothetical protein